MIIIGGGISGCAVAYYLACEGLEVILLERSGLNGESSGANSGSLHGQIPHEVFLEKGIEWAHNFGPTLKLLKDSIHLWKDLERLLETEKDENSAAIKLSQQLTENLETSPLNLKVSKVN